MKKHFKTTPEQKKVLIYLINNNWEMFIYKTDIPKGKLSFEKKGYTVTFNYIDIDITDPHGHIEQTDRPLDYLKQLEL